LTEQDGFRNEIGKALDELAHIVDQMEKELKQNVDLRTEGALRSVASSHDQLAKAFCFLDPSYKVPPDAKESWEHFFAKNKVLDRMKPEEFFSERGYGGMQFDVIAKIKGEYVIIEVETKPTNCIKKIERIKKAIGILVAEEIETFGEDNVLFSEIRKQLQDGKALRIIFAVTKRPIETTVKNITRAGNSVVHPEVYYCDPKL
jgi:hypothetical protein